MKNQESFEGMRQMWIAVAVAAISDAITAVRKSEAGPEKALRRVMLYFRGRHWRELCDLAGISGSPDAIGRLISTYDGPANELALRKAFGIEVAA